MKGMVLFSIFSSIKAVASLQLLVSVRRIFTKLFILTLLFAQFADATPPPGFPDVQHLGHHSHHQAVLNLFNYEAEDVRALKFSLESAGQHEAIFSARYAGQYWFVKIMRMTSENPPSLHFEYEWELKAALAGDNPLVFQGGEIVFADRAAFFSNEEGDYYIASYPFLSGKTIGHLAEQYRSTRSSEDYLSFIQAIYRYSQVSAHLHFDPNDPPKDYEDILERPVRIYLEDRHGFNEIYDIESDKVFLIDYAPRHVNYGASIPVKTALLDAFYAALRGFDRNDPMTQVIIDFFVSSYPLALPRYDDERLRNIIFEYLRDK